MNTYKTLYFIFLLAVLSSCGSGDELIQEQQAQRINQLFSEIKDLSSSVKCNDASKWAYTSYGHKACGGPLGYIAYSTQIDTVLFMQKIEEHRTLQEKFNEDWGIVSDCSLTQEPSGIKCEEKEAILIF